MEFIEPLMEAIRDYDMRDLVTGVALIPIVYAGYVAKNLIVDRIGSDAIMDLHLRQSDDLERRMDHERRLTQ
jgi:hypothetical protein